MTVYLAYKRPLVTENMGGREVSWYFYGLPPSHVSIPPNQKGQSQLLNQTFISAECVRSIRLSTDMCLRYSLRQLSACIIADWSYA